MSEKQNNQEENKALKIGGVSSICPNCKEIIHTDHTECACLRNKCVRCKNPVGNITFSLCDYCWQHRTI